MICVGETQADSRAFTRACSGGYLRPFLFAFLPPGKKAAGGEEAASADQRKSARAASDLVGNRGDLAGEDFGAGAGDLRREP